MRIRLNSTVQGLLEELQPRFPKASDANDLLIQALTILLYQCNPQQTVATLPTLPSIPAAEGIAAPKDAVLNLLDD